MSLHPRQALFDSQAVLPTLPVVDHYAGNVKFIRKALELQQSYIGKMDVTLDLEDGAPRGEEVLRRTEFIDLLNQRTHIPRYTGVRIHEPSSRWFESDVLELLQRAPDAYRYITIPKCLDYAEAEKAVATVERIASTLQLSSVPRLRLLIETPLAARDVWSIATLPHLEGLDFGCMDFVSAHGGALSEECMHSPGQFTNALIRRAKTELCAAALANHLVPSHNVTVEFNNPDIVLNDATTASKNFGFLRMWSIHPSQIDPIISAMLPSNELLHKATEVLTAGFAVNWAPTKVHSRLHDRASYRYYWNLLSRANELGTPVPEEVKNWF